MSSRLFARVSLVTFLVMAAPLGAQTTDLAGNDLLIPIAGRTSGALGSEWRTDLTVTNVSPSHEASAVFLTFTRSDAADESFVSRALRPRETLILADAILDTFGYASAIGIIRITSPNGRARITANARIYNTANAVGEFGQAVTAVPVDALMREHYLTGLTSLNGNRTNVGLSNPWDLPTLVSVTLFDRDGGQRGRLNTVVGARKVLPLNDFFHHIGVEPLEGATISVSSTFGLYPYVSVVRNDSGDAHFITGTGFARGHSVLVATSCSNASPAIIAPTGFEAEGWLVKLRDDEPDIAGRAAQLAAQYGFTLKSVFEFVFRGFSANLSPEQIAALRCDQSVVYVAQNSMGFLL